MMNSWKRYSIINQIFQNLPFVLSCVFDFDCKVFNTLTHKENSKTHSRVHSTCRRESCRLCQGRRCQDSKEITKKRLCWKKRTFNCDGDAQLSSNLSWQEVNSFSLLLR